MSNFEVPSPILNSPFEEPKEHWWILEGKPAERRAGRRPAMYFYREPDREADGKGGLAIELKLANLIRQRVKAWRESGYAGVTRTTLELLHHWRREAIQPDTANGEAPEVPILDSSRGPGSTRDVDFWTSREVREVTKSHLNYVVADTKKWEQQAAYFIDTHAAVRSFAKNAGLGFGIPYLHNGQMHDYVPDFIIRIDSADERYVILETKGFDPLKEVKQAAAHRWCAAVNANGQFGAWEYRLAEKASDVRTILNFVSIK